MKKTITFISFLFFLASCASPAPELVPTTTPIPSPTQTATATSTATPVPTSTITATPDPLEGLPEELKEFSRIDGNTVDVTDGIAYDADGKVHWAQGASGEWVNFVDGAMAFPAGDGSGAPDLLAPYVSDFNSFAALFGSDLPWNDMGVDTQSREKEEDRLYGPRYITPYYDRNPWTPIPLYETRVHKTENPAQWARITIGNFMLPGERMVARVTWRSKSSDALFRVFIDEDANGLGQLLTELNYCYGDMGASSDTVCETDIFIP